MNLPLHEESFVPCLFSRGITREIDLQCFHTAKEEPMKGATGTIQEDTRPGAKKTWIPNKSPTRFSKMKT